MENNSQSSDVFFDERDYKCENSFNMNTTVNYDSLVSDTKLMLSKHIQNEIHIATCSSYLSSILDNCYTCICQSFDLIIDMLSTTDMRLTNLCSYMENAGCILLSLTNFIKNVIQSMSVACSGLGTFPTTTGQILMAVFSHCKHSETIYGNHLKSVENQLKNLFKNSHELQLTYLMILDKHIIFDLNEKNEVEILVEALEINLKIGQIVQTLDVKTMAEQWKAYTMLCEKYSHCLKDKQIYYSCSKVLCDMIQSNIKSALEVGQEEKMILRSLKVASFTIKILLRVCNIFRDARSKKCDHILELLIFINLKNSLGLKINVKDKQFLYLMKTNVGAPIEALQKELIMDEWFVNIVLNMDINEMNADKILGYILLITSLIKPVLQNEGHEVSKTKIIECIYRFLYFGHIWLNIGLKFEIITEADNYFTYGLYEHLLTSTLALSSTLRAEEMNLLEQKMFEAILSTECYCAIFSCNLWTLLARFSTRQLLLSQLFSLLKIYKNLDKNNQFHHSPQQVHLSFTITKLFEVIHIEDKMKVYKQFNLEDDFNISVWSALKIKSLPKNVQSNAKEMVVEKLKMKLDHHLTSGLREINEIESLIKTMELAATCSFAYKDDHLEDRIVKAWMKLCPNKEFVLSQELDSDSVWVLNYIEALAKLTEAFECLLPKSDQLIKILHVVTKTIERGKTDVKLVLLNLFCHLLFESSTILNDYDELVVHLLAQSFKSLLNDTELVRSKFYTAYRKYSKKCDFESIILKVAKEDFTLKESWYNFMDYGKRNVMIMDWEELSKTASLKYIHTCVESKNVIDLSNRSFDVMVRSNSNNFEFADIDTLFDADSDSEKGPACKKLKLNGSDAEEIIARLENDATLLCNVKENVFSREWKNRVRDICEKLLKIID